MCAYYGVPVDRTRKAKIGGKLHTVICRNHGASIFAVSHEDGRGWQFTNPRNVELV